MKPRLLFVHTLASLVDVFNRLAGRRLPSVERLHIVDEPLLERVRRRGALAPEDSERLRRHVEMAGDIGAGAVLVTCSTISPCVDQIRRKAGIPVLKIDEAMIAEALARGKRIAILATNHATLEPTHQAVLAEAARAGKQVQTELILVEDALDALRSGDLARHDSLIAKAALELIPRAGVVMLAQASMARAIDTIPANQRATVLSSPHLALAALAALFRPPSPPPAENAGESCTASTARQDTGKPGTNA